MPFTDSPPALTHISRLGAIDTEVNNCYLLYLLLNYSAFVRYQVSERGIRLSIGGYPLLGVHNSSYHTQRSPITVKASYQSSVGNSSRSVHFVSL